MNKTIGKYEIQSELGQGGMAQVFLAYDPSFRRQVALKLLAPAIQDNPGLKTRFEREARFIAAIEHPAITPVYDFGEQDGQLYLVMRYMPGGSVADMLNKGPLDLRQAVGILAQVAPALDAVHAQGIVHRDLKPANLLLDRFGNAAIADFGIAYFSDATSALTGEGIIGTPHYMSPEQVQGERDLDGRSDIYALGVIAFQMLAGRQPYQSTTPLGVVLKHISEPVPSIYTIRPDLPAGLDAVFEKAMAKDRNLRYAKASELVTDLRAVLEGTVRLGVNVEAAVRPSAREAPTELEVPAEQPSAAPEKEPEAPARTADSVPPPSATERKAPSQPPPSSTEWKIGEGLEQAAPDQSALAASEKVPPRAPTGVVDSVPFSSSIERKAPSRAADSVPLPGSQGLPVKERQIGVEQAAVPARSMGMAAAPSRAAAPAQAVPKAGSGTRTILMLGAGVAVVFICGVLFLVAAQVGFNLLGRGATPTTVQTAVQEATPTTGEGVGTPQDQSAPTPGRVLASDDFSDANSGWPVGEDRQSVYGYLDGSYFLRVLELDTLLWAGPDVSYGDVRISVDATWNSDEQSGYYGLYCRLEDEFNYYYFVMLASGREYSIGKYVDGQFTSLLPGRWNASDFIPAGRATSRLEAVCAGTTLSFSINGNLLNGVNDIVFSSGQTGVVAAALTEHAEVLFDNYLVEEMAP